MMAPWRRHGPDLALVDPLFQSRIAYAQLSRSFRDVEEFHGHPLINYGLIDVLYANQYEFPTPLHGPGQFLP